MVLKKYLNKMVDRERRELDRRAATKKKRTSLFKRERKELKKKIISFKPKGRLSANAYTKAIGNPYSVKLPKPEKKRKFIKIKGRNVEVY